MNQRLSILIADDSIYFRQQAVRFLRERLEDSVIAEAADGKQVLALVEQALPDIVLLDLSMPGLTGFDVLPRLRDMPSGPAVIVVSGLSEDSYRQEVQRLGAMAVVPKKRFVDDIIGTIERVLSNPSNEKLATSDSD